MADSLKVLQVHARYRGRGGEDTTVESEAGLLRSAGHQVELFEAANAPTAPRAAAQLAVSAWNPLAARRLAGRIEELEPDVVHVHNTWFSLSPAVVRAASGAGVPVVVTLQNYRLVCVSANLYRDGGFCEDCVGRGPWPGIRHRCYHDSATASAAVATNIVVHRRLWTWARHADAVIAVSKFGIDRHIAGGVPRDRLVLKDNFCAPLSDRPAPPSASDTVLFVGRPEPEKGLALLLDAWDRSRPDGLRLEVIGEAGQTAAPAPEGVSFTGPLPREAVLERMLGARALLVPSQWPEGQPLVVLEALAAGLPVVGSATGGVAEVLGEDPDAQLIGFGDRAGWEQALVALNDDALVDARGRRALEIHAARFTPEIALESLLRVYATARERHSSRSSAEATGRPSST